MEKQKQKLQWIGMTFAATAMLGGCSTAGNYQPIVDGAQTAQYKTDLDACQHLAEKRSYMNDDVKVAAALGSVIGVLAGKKGDDILTGALVGASIAGGERAWDTREERKSIIMKCMVGRGHRVVG